MAALGAGTHRTSAIFSGASSGMRDDVLEHLFLDLLSRQVSEYRDHIRAVPDGGRDIAASRFRRALD
jgi:hypothetical protein